MSKLTPETPTTPNAVPLDDWVTIGDVSAATKLHYQTVFREVRSGRLPASKIGRSWRIRASAVDAWMNSMPGNASSTEK